MPKISQSHIKAWRVILPPVSEQEEIVEAVEREIQPVQTVIIRAEREMSLMQEYRMRLTADIVVGKWDVREATARLSDLPSDTLNHSAEKDDLSEEPEPEETE